jgi:hypothetical protein
MLLAHVNSPNLQLRGAATDCLVEVVSKRMEPTAKVQLVQELRIAPAIAAWTASVAAAAAAVSGGRPGALAALSAACSGSSSGAGVHVPPEQAAAAAAMLEDEEILGKYATLLATTAGEVMDALKRIENSEWLSGKQVLCLPCAVAGYTSTSSCSGTANCVLLQEESTTRAVPT